MKRYGQMVSLILSLALIMSLCSCQAGDQKQASDTTIEVTTETTAAETTTAAPTPTPEPPPTPTPTPTPTPVPNYTVKKVFSLMASTMGKTPEKAESLVEDFLGTSLGEPQTVNLNREYNIDITIEGISFNDLSIQTGKGKNKGKVVFVAFSNNADEKGQLQSYYSKYSKLLKKKYKKPVSTSKSKTMVYSVYKINKKYETNTGWYFDAKGNGRSFWINYYLK